MLNRDTAYDVLAAAALSVAVLAGKFALPFLGEIRLPFMLVAIALTVLRLRQVTLPVVAGALFLLIGYLFGRALFDVGQLTAQRQLDLVYLAGQMLVVCAFAARPVFVVAIGAITVVLSAAYLGVVLVMNDGFGLGWGPVGTAVTFNRVMFLGFCATICFAPLLGRLHFLAPAIASPFLFACIASLQKSALLGVAVASIFLVAQIWRQGSKRIAFGYFSAGVLAVFGATLVYGDQISYRLGAAFSPDDRVAAVEGYAATPEDALYRISTRYCVFEADELVCREGLIADGTSRLIFWAEAARGFLEAPIIGNGIGTFEVSIVNPNTLLPDSYLYPHNIIAEIGYEAGSIGLILLFVAFVAAFSSGGGGHTDYTRVGLITFMAFMLVTVMLAGDFYDSRLFWLSAAILAVVSGQRRVNQ